MLAITPLINSTPGERAGDESASNLLLADDFSADFNFDLSDFFAGFDDGDALPGLDVDLPSPDTVGVEPEILERGDGVQNDGARVVEEEVEEETVSILHEEVLSCETMQEESTIMSSEVYSSAPVGERRRKPSPGPGKCSIGKRKMKVDWTRELHRQFVQAVEQLGVEKAVPSRILELMGVNCLTRHNVASHLQKYRSHRKHMLVREAESTRWAQRSMTYLMATAITTGNNTGVKQKINPWTDPTMGFPSSAHHPLHMHTFRTLHVWGHPTMDQSLAHMWHPKHLFSIRPAPSPSWVAPHHPPFQHPHLLPHTSPRHPQFFSGILSPGAPCFLEQVPTARFPTPMLPEKPPHTIYRPENALLAATAPTPVPTKQSGWQLQHGVHPSNESIDEEIKEVLAQPWLPMPLGLKPPSLESVIKELQKQGISNVPPCIRSFTLKSKFVDM